MAINPSSVQGPGRSSGTGVFLIAYLNGRLPVFVNTHVSIVDVDDCADGHILAAQRGRAGERYILNGASVPSADALRAVEEITGVRERVRMLPHPVITGAAALVEGGFRLSRRSPPICRARVRTILHGHRYDGSRAVRDLGLTYRPFAETLRRTVEWAVEEGLVKRPLPALASSGQTERGHVQPRGGVV